MEIFNISVNRTEKKLTLSRKIWKKLVNTANPAHRDLFIISTQSENTAQHYCHYSLTVYVEFANTTALIHIPREYSVNTWVQG